LADPLRQSADAQRPVPAARCHEARAVPDIAERPGCRRSLLIAAGGRQGASTRCALRTRTVPDHTCHGRTGTERCLEQFHAAGRQPHDLDAVITPLTTCSPSERVH
jgi:hypothetical protein